MAAEALARYDKVAESYAATHSDSYEVEPDVCLLEQAGPVEGRDVLDLACGHGRFARELRRRRASVVALDLSAELLVIAKATERDNPLGIEYLRGDASSPEVLVGRSFDLVVSSFGLSDIDDLDGVLATVARLLRPGGAFVFSLLHPCFPGCPPTVSAAWPPTAGYFAEDQWFADAARSTLRQEVGANHRMLSTYLNALVRHGLEVVEVTEPEPPAEWMHSIGLAEPVPTYLVVRCQAKGEKRHT